MPRGSSKSNGGNSADDNDAIRHIKQGVVDGKTWYIALLEAIALWTCPDESYKGHHYQYLIDGEAFDWLLLSERLCKEISDSIPEKELIDLLFFGKLPIQMSEDEFRELIGDAKYHAYLNYLYGVTVEQFIILAIEDEIHKERHANELTRTKEESADSYQRLYGVSQDTLLRLFREEKKYTQKEDISLEELQAFTYWLFKYRLKNSDRARLASDTKKGIEHLRRQKIAKGIKVDEASQPYIIDNDSLSK